MSNRSAPRILVVDDNLEIHEDFRKIFAPPSSAPAAYDAASAAFFGRSVSAVAESVVRVEFASQGQEAMQRVQAALKTDDHYAAAFVDMRMPPGWDGLETTLHLWKAQPELLVVLCTAFADYSWTEITRRLERSDRFLILKKPFDPIEARQLAQSLVARAVAEHGLQVAQRQLSDASRLAGMAEVATSVLHNVGNVLNSLNVSTELVREKLEKSRVGLLRKSVDLLLENRHRLTEFLASEAKGQALPDYLDKLARHFEAENAALRSEWDEIGRHVDHIKQIVSAQQNYGRVFGAAEVFDPAEVFNEALRLNTESLERHRIEVGLELRSEAKVTADRHKVLQILVNLLRNAEQAVIEADPSERRIVLRTWDVEPGRAAFSVSDTGIGIDAEQSRRMFHHGFTTKKDGHGFGLHSSVLAAREMKGNLTFQSEGRGRGATFTLELPLSPPNHKAVPVSQAA